MVEVVIIIPPAIVPIVLIINISANMPPLTCKALLAAVVVLSAKLLMPTIPAMLTFCETPSPPANTSDPSLDENEFVVLWNTTSNGFRLVTTLLPPTHALPITLKSCPIYAPPAVPMLALACVVVLL